MTADDRIFELRTYTPFPGKRDVLLGRLRNTIAPLFEKHGMANIGYWVEVDDNDQLTEKVVYLLAHASREAAIESWTAVVNDPAFLELKANGENPTENIVKQFLSPTDFSPVR